MEVSTRVCNRVVYNDELYHHGIKGQKWGIRRFQTLSGKLTSLGKKRVAGQDVEQSTTNATKKSSGTSNKPKTVREMSDAELTSAITRMQREKQYKQLYSEMHPVTPKQSDKIKKILKDSGDKLVKDVTNAAANKAKDYASKKIKEALGLNDTEAEQLKKMKDYISKQQTIRDYKEAKRKATDEYDEQEKMKRDSEYAKNRNIKDNNDWQYEKRQDDKAEYRASKEAKDNYDDFVNSYSDSHQASYTDITWSSVKDSYTHNGEVFISGILNYDDDKN